MGDKSERIALLEQRLDDMAIQFESIVKMLSESRRIIERQQTALASLQRKVSRKS
ncbi:hypothetical protein [Pseudomonas phage PA1C]|uniref:Uncharacterized protein n=1 Tax=Pseudomonas phage vB_PaeM_PS119XW TaxID=2601632 RepID=A0A5C1K909_9CAUD|nr:hypothetical protein PP933_gp262 [Pseudomonas phage vB_PaeM_PS119XW]QBX32420.1 hypothetical protein [Pseudomonas phage PA1C]QEM41991.1 hypothetical protein [Pseudomonas phage vB_PaeM_PS119XW]